MAIPANQFYDTDRLTTWVLNLLYIGIFLTVVSFISTMFELRLLEALEQGAFESEEAFLAVANVNDRRQQIIGWMELGWYVIAGTISLIWIYRSAHNAGVHATRMDFTPGSCVWWYFIPIATFWKPFQAMREVWNEAARQAGEDADGGGALLGVWWFTWLAMNIVYQVSFRAALRDNLVLSDQAAQVGAVMDVICAIAFILMIKTVSRRLKHVQENPPAAQPAVPGANW